MGRSRACSSVYPKMKTEFMQTVNLLAVLVAIESQRIKHLSLCCLSNIITYKEIFKKNLISSLKPGLKSSVF